MIQKQKYLTASLLVLLVCGLLYSDVREKRAIDSSSLLRRGNLALEHDVSLMQELHSPFGKEEHIIPESDRKDLKDIKYVSFGSSHTWGATLKNRDEETYVKQLAKPYFENGVNHGIRSSGPNYPANCLYSLIGEEHFDVIVLEFYMHAYEGLMELAVRLRQRFPDAVMVFVHHWMPLQIVNEGIRNERNRPVNLDEYRNNMGFGSDFIHNPEFHELIKTTPDQWRFNKIYDGIEKLSKEVANAVNGYIVKTPLNDKRDGDGGWVHFGDQLLSTDSFHPSPKAHAFIANQVRDIVDRVGVPKNPRVEPFAQKDQCYNWLMDGNIDPSISYGSGFKLKKMPNTQKYSLEFQNDVPLEGNNYITVNNGSDDTMDMFVGYLTTSPEQKYPMVEASRSNGQKFELKPKPENTYGGKSIHVPEMVHLGFMKPKTTLNVYFTPLEESEWPFRITSIMIIPRVESDNKDFHSIGGSPLP